MDRSTRNACCGCTTQESEAPDESICTFPRGVGVVAWIAGACRTLGTGQIVSQVIGQGIGQGRRQIDRERGSPPHAWGIPIVVSPC